MQSSRMGDGWVLKGSRQHSKREFKSRVLFAKVGFPR